jgi:hypothetical protein
MIVSPAAQLWGAHLDLNGLKPSTWRCFRHRGRGLPQRQLILPPGRAMSPVMNSFFRQIGIGSHV